MVGDPLERLADGHRLRYRVMLEGFSIMKLASSRWGLFVPGIHFAVPNHLPGAARVASLANASRASLSMPQASAAMRGRST